MAESRLQLVGQETDDVLPVASPEKESRINRISGDALVLALTALSQRAVVALAAIFPLLMVGSAFWLWYVTPQPDAYQIAKLFLYGTFVLGAIWMTRRR